MCSSFCKSVVDHTKVRLDTLVYLISERAGDDFDSVKKYIDKLKSIWEFLKSQTTLEVMSRMRPLLLM